MMMVPSLLVTDDDHSLRGLLCEALSRSGFHVLQARDGREAIDVIASQPLHFALVDVHMPRVNGLDVMRHLMQIPDHPPCALMSAELTDQIVAEAQRMNVYRILSKPIRVAHIRQVVCGALAEAYGWTPD